MPGAADPQEILPLGKLPASLLEGILRGAPVSDPRVLLGPGTGLDCAVIDTGGPDLLVLKSDPITFTGSEIGWYAVQINANDIATTGAVPRWMLATLLLPEGKTTPALAENIAKELFGACSGLGISLVGGHTEVTRGLDRPVMIGSLIGEVPREKLVTPRGAHAGDRILLTKGVPVEATAILARDFAGRLLGALSPEEIQRAAGFLQIPGISVFKDAQVALAAGRVTAMHDPTEGGLASALWELAEASQKSLHVEVQAVPIPDLSARICRALAIEPLASIASGALLLTTAAEAADPILQALQKNDIACAVIGRVESGPPGVWTEEGIPLPRPARDEIARLYELIP